MEKEQSTAEEFIGLVGTQDILQKKSLHKIWNALTVSEKEELEQVLVFFLKHHSMQFLVEAWLLFQHDVRKEMRYLRRYKRYRYSSVKEVGEKVYHNAEYMEKYMLGVQVSGYLWRTHRQMHKWYREVLEKFSGDFYLEIGPGHGQFFCEAVNLQKFNHYVGVDISETSIRLAGEYIECFKKKDISNYEFICEDFIEMKFACSFDGVCISEVLEHLEQPDMALKKIYDITNPGASVYIAVPINGPSIDHIYLFHTIEEVLLMCREAGFDVADYFYVTEIEDISYEKALEMGCAIILAVYLRHPGAER